MNHISREQMVKNMKQMSRKLSRLSMQMECYAGFNERFRHDAYYVNLFAIDLAKLAVNISQPKVEVKK